MSSGQACPLEKRTFSRCGYDRAPALTAERWQQIEKTVLRASEITVLIEQKKVHWSNALPFQAPTNRLEARANM